MYFKYRDILPEDFDPSSRVWIYQSSRPFTLSEVNQLNDMLHAFVATWNSHGVPVKGYANVFYGQFILLMADETASGVSGCSTDSSVRLMKQVERTFDVQVFDRLMLAFLVHDQVQFLPLGDLDFAFQNESLSPDTLYFNNTVQTKKELIDRWLIPLRESWLKQRLSGRITPHTH